MKKLHAKVKYRLREGDEVIVLTGRDSGKTGKIQSISRKKGKVKIPSVNMVKKHRRATQEKQSGEIVDIPAYLDISNIMILCPSCKQGVRIRIERTSDKKRKRLCHRCGYAFDKKIK